MNDGFDQTRILYRDKDVLVVNKLLGEAVEGSSEGMVDLPAVLADTLRIKAPYAVHRLDVPVSGCALFALNPRALALLNTVFAEGKATKLYWAIVEKPEDGKEIPRSGELVHWIWVDAKKNVSHAFDEDGKNRREARLRYQIVGEGDNYLFLEIDLLSGRHHQIRAQLQAIGLHIKGDLKYGSRRSEKTGGIRLHARSLSFPDVGKEEASVYVEAPILNPDPLWQAFEAAVKAYH